MERLIAGLLENCELVNEKGNYYLKLVYNYEDYNYKNKITFPRVLLPINKLIKIESDDKKCYIWTSNMLGDYDKFFKVYKSGDSYRTEDGTVVDMSFSPSFYVIEGIEEKAKKMTLKDIEKELGYKIELIK